MSTDETKPTTGAIYAAIAGMLADVDARPVAGFENYLALADGRILSTSKGNTGKPGFLKPIKQVDGYCHVTLTAADKSRKVFGAHVVIAEAYHGPRQDGMTVNHKNGDKSDNRSENLEWVTQSRNVRHAYETGLRTINDGHKQRCKRLGIAKRKLTFDQAEEIRRLFAAGGVSKTAIALKFGINRKSVGEIIQGRLYSEAV